MPLGGIKRTVASALRKTVTTFDAFSRDEGKNPKAKPRILEERRLFSEVKEGWVPCFTTQKITHFQENPK